MAMIQADKTTVGGAGEGWGEDSDAVYKHL